MEDFRVAKSTDFIHEVGDVFSSIVTPSMWY